MLLFCFQFRLPITDLYSELAYQELLKLRLLFGAVDDTTSYILAREVFQKEAGNVLLVFDSNQLCQFLRIKDALGRAGWKVIIVL